MRRRRGSAALGAWLLLLQLVLHASAEDPTPSAAPEAAPTAAPDGLAPSPTPAEAAPAAAYTPSPSPTTVAAALPTPPPSPPQPEESGPRIVLSPSDLEYEVIAYRRSASQRVISVSNTGSAPLLFTTHVDPAATWLRVLPPDSTVQPGWVDQITVTVTPGLQGEAFSAVGNYRTNLTIRSNDGTWAEIGVTFYMSVENRAPEVRLSQAPVVLGLADEAVTLDASGSVDADTGRPVARWAWSWAWEPAPSARALPAPLADERGPKIAFSRLYGGVLRANVTGTDGEGASGEAAVAVFVPAEALEVSFAYGPSEALPGPAAAPDDTELRLFAVYVSEALETFPAARLTAFSFAPGGPLPPSPSPAPGARRLREAAAASVRVRFLVLPAIFEQSAAAIRTRLGALEGPLERLEDRLGVPVGGLVIGATVPARGGEEAGGGGRRGGGFNRSQMDADEGVEFILDPRARGARRRPRGRGAGGRGRGGAHASDAGRLVSGRDGPRSELFHM
eukprot:tig00001343_g8331.t1